ncbi:MAG TPA: DNA alkylation repair protein [Candidatus Babeliales bacterium]|nr:DNA alkylation repair protein [Candidatus Babeliales bacterium]
MAEQFLNQIQQIFSLHADPIRAHSQQQYMKSSMPFWGIPKPTLTKLIIPIIKQHEPQSLEHYKENILYTFQNAQHREEWYAAVMYSRHYKLYIRPENIDLYINIILISQWWDIVDEVADHLIGKALLKVQHREKYFEQWIKHHNLWIRRTALIAQLKYKKQTDFNLLTNLILEVAYEKEFFIRKAIGWSLREYSKTNPEVVRNFIENHKHQLSTLSIREGLKILERTS